MLCHLSPKYIPVVYIRSIFERKMTHSGQILANTLINSINYQAG